MPLKTDKKIGLFGLSANPPHDGHIAMAQYAKDMLSLEEIWWVVAAQNPLKPPHELAPFQDRYEMACDMAIDHDWLKVTDIENREGVNKSFDMLTLIKQQNPKQDFTWIIGGDNLTSFHEWYKWQEIINMIPIAVMARPGEMEKAVKSKAMVYVKAYAAQQSGAQKNRFILLDNPLVPISSTKIRNAFKNHPKTVQGTHPNVIQRIREKGLYL